LKANTTVQSAASGVNLRKVTAVCGLGNQFHIRAGDIRLLVEHLHQTQAVVVALQVLGHCEGEACAVRVRPGRRLLQVSVCSGKVVGDLRVAGVVGAHAVGVKAHIHGAEAERAVGNVPKGDDLAGVDGHRGCPLRVGVHVLLGCRQAASVEAVAVTSDVAVTLDGDGAVHVALGGGPTDEQSAGNNGDLENVHVEFRHLNNSGLVLYKKKID